MIYIIYRENIVNICKIEYNKDLENKVIGTIHMKVGKIP